MSIDIISPVIDLCKLCYKGVGRPLKKHLLYFAENIDKFKDNKNVFEALRRNYEAKLVTATTKLEKPTEEVIVWIQKYDEIKERCDRLNLPYYERRKMCSYKRFKFSKKLVKYTQEMKEHYDQYYDHLRPSLFVRDPVLYLAEMKKKFKEKREELKVLKKAYEERLSSATRKCMKPREEVKLWIEEYDGIINRRCDKLEIEEESKQLVEMKEKMNALIERYNHFHHLEMFVMDPILNFPNIKKNFERKRVELEALKEEYEEGLSKAKKQYQTSTKVVKLWIKDFDELESKWTVIDKRRCGHGNIESEIETEAAEYSHYQEEIMEMEEMIEKINELIHRYNQFHHSEMFVDQPSPIVEKQTTNYIPIGSIEDSKKKVKEALKNKSVIGLLGMGGVGKTTMMQKINNEIADETDFKLVVWVTVSKDLNIKKLQDEIARRLELKLGDSTCTNVRANKISEYLKQNGSTLMIFDDVWEKLDLKAIGVPDSDGENNHCKIVLTTRIVDVCRQMDNVVIIPMACLNAVESWKLFESNSGSAFESESIKAIAEDVCKECAGLPLAISVVALTLKNEKEEYYWDLFRLKLKENNPKGLSIIQEKVYISLKLSYDHLKRDDIVDGEHLQLCFLFCILFPEDHEIHLHDLMYYGIGEDFVACHEGVSALHYTLILIGKLKGYGLLLDVSRGEMYVKMHDVVRDAAIFIARNVDKLGFYTSFKGMTKWPEGGESKTRKRISLMGNSIQHVVVHPKFDGKQMRTLLLNDNEKLETIANSFFKEMEDLLVLDMRETKLKSLPSSIQNLTKLRVFMVSSILKNYYSMNLQHLISMKCLSILILRDSRRIPELTKEFGDLVHLKVLDFTNTKIDIMWSDVLSKLVNLEKLLMQGSFDRWDDCSEDGKSFASIFELGYLKCLCSLYVYVANDQKILSKRAPNNFLQSFVDRGQKQHIFFHINFVFPNHFHIENVKENKLSLKGELQFPKWIFLLMKETEILTIEECKSFQQQLMQNCENTEDYGVFKNLRELNIISCENWEDVVLLKSNALKFLLKLESLVIIYICKLKRVIEYYSPNRGDDIAILPKLVSIDLQLLDELEDIFASTVTPTVMPNGSFQGLKTIAICSCSKLKVIFPWNVAVCLVQLEFLLILDCFQLEVIVGKVDSDYDQVACALRTRILFPKLREMELEGLPNLENLWQQQSEKRMEMELPSLEIMTLYYCDKLNRLFWGHESAPSLKHLYLRTEECFEKLIWEDDQAATRFKRCSLAESEKTTSGGRHQKPLILELYEQWNTTP